MKFSLDCSATTQHILKCFHECFDAYTWYSTAVRARYQSPIKYNFAMTMRVHYRTYVISLLKDATDLSMGGTKTHFVFETLGDLSTFVETLLCTVFLCKANLKVTSGVGIEIERGANYIPLSVPDSVTALVDGCLRVTDQEAPRGHNLVVLTLNKPTSYCPPVTLDFEDLDDMDLMFFGNISDGECVSLNTPPVQQVPFFPPAILAQNKSTEPALHRGEGLVRKDSVSDTLDTINRIAASIPTLPSVANLAPAKIQTTKQIVAPTKIMYSSSGKTKVVQQQGTEPKKGLVQNAQQPESFDWRMPDPPQRSQNNKSNHSPPPKGVGAAKKSISRSQDKSNSKKRPSSNGGAQKCPQSRASKAVPLLKDLELSDSGEDRRIVEMKKNKSAQQKRASSSSSSSSGAKKVSQHSKASTKSRSDDSKATRPSKGGELKKKRKPSPTRSAETTAKREKKRKRKEDIVLTSSSEEDDDDACDSSHLSASSVTSDEDDDEKEKVSDTESESEYASDCPFDDELEVMRKQGFKIIGATPDEFRKHIKLATIESIVHTDTLVAEHCKLIINNCAIVIEWMHKLSTLMKGTPIRFDPETKEFVLECNGSCFQHCPSHWQMRSLSGRPSKDSFRIPKKMSFQEHLEKAKTKGFVKKSCADLIVKQIEKFRANENATRDGSEIGPEGEEEQTLN